MARAPAGYAFMHVMRLPFTMNQDGVKEVNTKNRPPWYTDLDELFESHYNNYVTPREHPNLQYGESHYYEKEIENELYNRQKKAWLFNPQDGQYVQMNPHESFMDQLDPSTKQFVVRVTPRGPNTTIYKYGTEIGHIGPMGVYNTSPLKVFGFRMRYQWGKLNTCIKVAVGILVAAVIAGTIIGSIAGACLTGSLTDAVACGNLGITVTGELPKITGRVIVDSEETTIVMQSCHNVSCAHGGSCSIEDNSIKCSCMEGYTGSRCEVESNIHSTKTTEITASTSEVYITAYTTEEEQTTTGFPQAQTDKTTDPNRKLYVIGLISPGIVLIGLIFAYYRVKSNKTAILPLRVSTPMKKSTPKRKKSSKRSKRTRKMKV